MIDKIGNASALMGAAVFALGGGMCAVGKSQQEKMGKMEKQPPRQDQNNQSPSD